MDISTAFLKGVDLKSARTTDDKERVACLLRPVNDFWEFLPAGVRPKDATHLALLLLCGVYGLKDAPALWSAELFRTCTEEMGCTQSVFDEATFYRRKRDTTNPLESLHAEVSELTLMATVHVDDVAVTYN